MLPDSPSSLSIAADVLDGTGAVRVAAPTDYYEDGLSGGDWRLHKVLAPAVGSFSAGERARLTVEADYGSAIVRDAVHVTRQPRFLLWRLSLSEEPLRIGDVRVRAFRVGDGLGDLSAIGGEARLAPEPGDGGLPSFSHALAFPPPNTLFVFEWEVLWR